MAKIIDPDNLNQATEIIFDTAARTIQLLVAGNLSNDGVTLQAVYSFCKEEWNTDANLIKFPFPLISITAEEFEIFNGWDWKDQTTKDLIRDGGWTLKNLSAVTIEQHMNITSLGSFDNSGTDQAYYQQFVNGAPTSIVLAGEVNQAIKIFEVADQFVDATNGVNINVDGSIDRLDAGDWTTEGYNVGGSLVVTNATTGGNNQTGTITAVTASKISTDLTFTLETADTAATINSTTDFRSYFKIYLREQGKIYGFYDLIIEQNLTALTGKKFALPLANAGDLKITAADVAIDANSDGTADVAPYTGMSITYNPHVNRGAWVIATAYVVDDVVQSAGGRWFICTVAGTSAVDDTDLAGGSDTGVTWIVWAQERQIGATWFSFGTIIDGNSATAEQIYEFVQWSLRQIVDIDAGSGVVRGDTAEDLLLFVGDTLRTLETVYGDGTYIDNFQATDTNRLEFTDDTGTTRTFPFVAAGNLIFNDNLQNDAAAKYWVFFTNDDAGDNAGADFGTASAVLIDDNSGVDITGNVSANATIAFDFDYDGNVQRGAGSAGTDAPYTAVANGLDTAQYVVTTGSIVRSTANAINYVAALERNYSNPA